ncbi:TasA family protein [Bacillus sp. S2(2024)]|uniref:TasA family protein n=1 Tax=Bacillus sp. S2(2024) TaxID=3162887 RepID=UPI003D1F40E1
MFQGESGKGFKKKSGTLDLNVDLKTIINVDNIKLGDTMVRYFLLKNDGSLDIKTVKLLTDYKVINAKKDNTDVFGKYIKVKFIWKRDKFSNEALETTTHGGAGTGNLSENPPNSNMNYGMLPRTGVRALII